MTKINKYGNTNQIGQNTGNQQPSSSNQEKGKFGQFMDDVADASLKTVSAVAPAFPGGQVVKMAADGLQQLRGQSPNALNAGSSEGAQLQEMWEMQRQNQAYNMQYFQLQQEAQAQNRRFKTMSNLMKVRHDTAKSAINNMRA